jgi:hypothetical protein
VESTIRTIELKILQIEYCNANRVDKDMWGEETADDVNSAESRHGFWQPEASSALKMEAEFSFETLCNV